MPVTRARRIVAALVVLVGPAFPCVALAQMQQQMLMQQRLWRLQQQQRQSIEQQQEQRQKELLQEDEELRQMATSAESKRPRLSPILRAHATISGCLTEGGACGLCRSGEKN